MQTKQANAVEFAKAAEKGLHTEPFRQSVYLPRKACRRARHVLPRNTCLLDNESPSSHNPHSIH